MYSLDFQQLIREQYAECKSYRKVAKLCKISATTVKTIVMNLHKKEKKKPGPKKIINGRLLARVERKFKSLMAEEQKVTARKLLNECEIINASVRTMRRTLSAMNANYKEAMHKIILTTVHRQKRVEAARQWIKDSHPWNKTAFTDEKRFNLDGPDSWCSWMYKERPIIRNRRQQGGGNVQVFGIILPGPFLFLFILEQRSNANDYVQFLESFIKPLFEELTDGECILQQDNASIHCAAETREWLSHSGLQTMQWPSRSPDLNIIENVWAMLSSIVYDGKQYNSKESLWIAIQKATEKINTEHREWLESLYDSMPRRILAVLDNKGAKIPY